MDDLFSEGSQPLLERLSCCGWGMRYMEMLRADPLASHMLGFVKDLLAPVDSMSKSGASLAFRSRYSHLERVTERALRICDIEGGDAGVIAVAAIFHDSGYCRGGDGHAWHSARIFDEYAAKHLPELLRGGATSSVSLVSSVSLASSIYAAVASAASLLKIREIIAIHSDKQMPSGDISLEARILMDADLLDEAGAMSVLFDCFLEASEQVFDYNSAFERILARYLSEDESVAAAMFHTKEGKRCFINTRRYVGEFINGLKDELCLQ